MARPPIELAATGFDVARAARAARGSGLAALHAVDRRATARSDAGNADLLDRASAAVADGTRRPATRFDRAVLAARRRRTLLRIVADEPAERPGDRRCVIHGATPGSTWSASTPARIVGWTRVERSRPAAIAYRDLATMATSLVDVVGPEALGPFLDAYGIDHADVAAARLARDDRPAAPMTSTGVPWARSRCRSSGRRRRASRRSPSTLARRDRDARARVGRLDAGVPGHGHRHGQADAGRAGRGAPPPHRPRRPVRGVRRRPVPARRGRGARRHRGARPPGPPRRRHRPLPAGRRRRPRRSRAGTRTCAPSSRPSPTPRRCTAGWPSSTRSPPSRMEPTNRRRVVRALEVTLGSGRPFSSLRPGLDAYPPTRLRRSSGSRSTATTLDAAHRAALRRASWRPGFLDEVRRAARRARAGCPAPPARPSATGSCSAHLAGDAARSTRPSTSPITPHPPLRPPPASAGSAATPASVARIAGRARCTWPIDRRAGAGETDAACGSPSTTASATTSSSCSTSSTAPRLGVAGDLAVRAVRPPHRDRRRRAAPRRRPPARAAADASTW